MFFYCCRDSAITPSVRTSASKTRSIFTRGGKEIFATAPLWTEKISRFGLGVSGTGRASFIGKKTAPREIFLSVRVSAAGTRFCVGNCTPSGRVGLFFEFVGLHSRRSLALRRAIVAPSGLGNVSSRTGEDGNGFAPKARSRRKENPLKAPQSLLKKGGFRPRISRASGTRR